MKTTESYMELTILMPCLNEEKTIEGCIRAAQQFIDKNTLDLETPFKMRRISPFRGYFAFSPRVFHKRSI